MIFFASLTAEKYPLDIFFTELENRYVNRSWGAFGSFLPEHLLQKGGDQADYFPVSAAEIDWLGTFMDTLEDPPWISARPTPDTPIRPGSVLHRALTNDREWTLLRLMLIAAELDGMDIRVGALGKHTIRRVFAHCRKSGETLPLELANAIDQLLPERRELVYAWLDKRVDFVDRTA